MILDIGSRYRPRGNINVDIVKYPGINCLADAHYLPFKDNTFDIVVANQLIEHCINPPLMIKEAIRVSKNKVIITTPNMHCLRHLLQYIIRRGFLVNEPEHLYGWTFYYMNNLMKAMEIKNYRISGISLYRDYSKIFYYLFTKPLSLFFDFSIKLEIWKFKQNIYNDDGMWLRRWFGNE